CARAILDGHIVLSRRLADVGHYPAIDIAASVSRCMSQASEPAQQGAARQVKELYGTYEKIKELIPLGGSTPGMDAKTDRAVQLAPALERFLRQETDEGSELAASIANLQSLLR